MRVAATAATVVPVREKRLEAGEGLVEGSVAAVRTRPEMWAASAAVGVVAAAAGAAAVEMGMAVMVAAQMAVVAVAAWAAAMAVAAGRTVPGWATEEVLRVVQREVAAESMEAAREVEVAEATEEMVAHMARAEEMAVAAQARRTW